MAQTIQSKWTVQKTRRYDPPKTPRVLIQAEAAGLEYGGQTATYPDVNTDRRIYVNINGTNVVNASAPRSYRFVQLRANSSGWSLIANNSYDVYGSQPEADAALAFLQTFQTDDLLIMNTWDEPTNRRGTFQNYLIEYFGSNMASYSREFRDAHLLIATYQTKTVFYEEHAPRYPTSTMPYCTMWLP